jgi:hypothetical protein
MVSNTERERFLSRPVVACPGHDRINGKQHRARAVPLDDPLNMAFCICCRLLSSNTERERFLSRQRLGPLDRAPEWAASNTERERFLSRLFAPSSSTAARSQATPSESGSSLDPTARARISSPVDQATPSESGSSLDDPCVIATNEETDQATPSESGSSLDAPARDAFPDELEPSSQATPSESGSSLDQQAVDVSLRANQQATPSESGSSLDDVQANNLNYGAAHDAGREDKQHRARAVPLSTRIPGGCLAAEHPSNTERERFLSRQKSKG